MSTSTKLNLQHDYIRHPVIAGVVVLAAICAGVIAFNRFAGAESGSTDSEASRASTHAPGSLDVKLDSSSSSSSNGSSGSTKNESSTTVTVNGESVPVDQSGSVHKTFTSDDGHSSVNISIENHSSTSGDSQ